MSLSETLPRVVYIAGFGRSGSTLLDILLGNHPAVFGAGELTEVFDELSRGATCSCGQTYAACDFWPGVRNRLEAELPGLSLVEATQVTRRVEASLSPWGLDRPTADHELYRRLWRTLLESLHQASGQSLIVDSSKSSRGTARRVLALTRLVGAQVSVIHLVRDPRAVLWSAFRGSNRLLEAGQRAMLRGGIYRMLIGWSMANTSVHLSKAADARIRLMRMRYEDLVSQPAAELRKAGRFLDLDFEPVVDMVDHQRSMNPGHGVGGNRMRRQGPVYIKADDEWKRALPAHARLIAVLAWPLARKYGYNVWRSAH